MTLLCAVPSCGRSLYSGNRTGVCRAHNHAAPFCRCLQCAGSGPTPAYRIATADEVVALNAETAQRGAERVAMSAAQRPKGVTLPAAPWEDAG